MSSLIQSMIDEREEELRLAQEEKARKKTETLKSLESEMKAYLGDFWKVLEDRVTRTGEEYNYKYETNNDGLPVRLWLSLPVMHEERLAPISIKWGPFSLVPSYHDHSQKFNVGGSYYSDLRAALRAAREGYPGYVESQRKERIDFYNKETSYHWRGTNKTEEEVREIISQCIAEFPEKKEQAEKRLAEWLRLRDEEAAEKLQQEERNKREEQERERKRSEGREYIQSLADWMEARDRVSQKNQSFAEGVQKLADGEPYTVYKLTYAIVADYTEDGESSREIETRSGYSLYFESGPFGFWDLDGRKLKVFNPISLEELFVAPSSGILSRKVEKAGIDLYFKPGTPDEEIEKILETIEELPAEPIAPDWVDRYYIGEYYKKARALLSERAGEGETQEEDF